MEIKQVNFEALESVSRKCITFAKDGNTVVKPYKTLYNVEQITHNPAHKMIYFEVVRGKESWEETSYCVFEDLGKIYSKVDWIPGYWTLDEFTEKIGNWDYFGRDGIIKRLKTSEENGWYINKLDIELCFILGEIPLVKHYTEYREKRIQEREKKEEIKRAEREAKEREEEENRIAQINLAIEEVEKAIISKKEVYNNEIDGKSVFLRLMKKYNINVPIKTQGWINNALARLMFTTDGKISYSYYKSSKNSTVFMEYLKELEEKVLQNVM